MGVAWLIVILTFISCVSVTSIPILNKELYKRVPLPLIISSIQMSATVPLVLFVGWIASSFSSSLSWCIPPRCVFWYVFLASAMHGCLILTYNLGLFFSDLELTVVFRFIGVILQGFLAKLFLHEPLSVLTIVSVVMVMIGTYFLTAKFEWTTEKLPSFSQILIQLLIILFRTASQILIKKTLNILKTQDQRMSPLMILPFRYFVMQFPMYLTALILESKNFAAAFQNAVTGQTIIIGLLSVVIGLIGQVVTVSLANLMSVLAYAIIGQLRSIPSLVVSHYWDDKPRWKTRQIFGFMLVGGAAFLFTWSKGGVLEDGAPLREEESGEEDGEKDAEFETLQKVSEAEFKTQNT
jgi:hypothetical protein